MMKRSLTLLLAAAVVAGCETTQSVSMLPPPTLDGPRILAQTPAPRPTPTPAPAPVATNANVPQGWLPKSPVRKWQYIVIHHSATPSGGAVAFDRMHRGKGWDELGYHFVIGNGTDSGDGAVEVGSRWPKQKYGAHCKTPDNRYNDFGIGICLVGNFDVERPTQKQLKALADLTGYLMKTYNVPANRVIGHGQAKATDCPGRNLSVASVVQAASKVAAATPAPGAQARPASGNLLVDVGRE